MKAGKIHFVGVALVLLFSGALFATDYYVDANNGNDDWDGTSATRGAGDVGPKKTLVGAMAITGLGSGDVVYAAEGYYTNGVAEVGTARYRVSVPARVHLVASGRASETFIVGEEAPAEAADRDAYGNGTGSMRCVQLNSGARLIGFTVTGGRTPAGSSGGGRDSGEHRCIHN